MPYLLGKNSTQMTQIRAQIDGFLLRIMKIHPICVICVEFAMR
jgi:hypothetical protein